MTSPPRHVGDLLRTAGVELAAGLGDGEIRDVEHRFGFRFVPEHRDFLSKHLPMGEGWPDWRSGDPAQLRQRLDWPVDGALYDVCENGFWPLTWGTRPHDQTAAIGVARGHLAAVPMLVPVYGHRYLPAAPAPSPAPVFSVYQTDVIYYGADLGDYVAREFFSSAALSSPPTPTVRIPFWSDLAEGADLAEGTEDADL